MESLHSDGHVIDALADGGIWFGEEAVEREIDGTAHGSCEYAAAELAHTFW